MERVKPLPPNVESYTAQITPLADAPHTLLVTAPPHSHKSSCNPLPSETLFEHSQYSESAAESVAPDASVQEHPSEHPTIEGIIYSANAAEPNHDDEPQPTRYNTIMGQLTFEELYAETQRIAGWVMREQLGMSNPEDIDDCLQAGYLKVWQKLEKDPEWLADKPKRYIVQAVVMRSKAQRFSHQRHYSKIVYDAQAGQLPESSMTTPQQVETWIDLSRALERVAQQAQQTQSHLLGLYCLVTQATITDVTRTFGYSHSTIQLYVVKGSGTGEGFSEERLVPSITRKS